MYTCGPDSLRVDGLGRWRCRNRRRRGSCLLAGQVHLAEWPDAILYRRLVLRRVGGVDALGEIGQLHGSDEYEECDDGEYADHQRVHIEKLLVPFQGGAPEKI